MKYLSKVDTAVDAHQVNLLSTCYSPTIDMMYISPAESTQTTTERCQRQFRPLSTPVRDDKFADFDIQDPKPFPG